MPTDPNLVLAQWMSPAFPVGSFAYSHGLEWAVAAGDVTDAATFQDWLDGVVFYGAGRNDLILLAQSFAQPDPSDLNELARAFAPSAERLAETVDQGAAFCTCVNAVWGLDLPTLTLPVALGQAARACNLPLPLTMAHYLQAFVSNLAGAAQRLVPLGQTAAQHAIMSVMAQTGPLIAEARASDLDDLGGAAFMADIAAMKHETQQTRLFRS